MLQVGPSGKTVERYRTLELLLRLLAMSKWNHDPLAADKQYFERRSSRKHVIEGGSSQYSQMSRGGFSGTVTMNQTDYTNVANSLT